MRGWALAPEFTLQPLPSSRLVAAPGPDSAGPTCRCGRDCPHTPPPPRPSSWSGPTSSHPSLDIHSWAPQFLSPATRAGVPPPQDSAPELSLPGKRPGSWVPGLGSGSCCVSAGTLPNQAQTPWPKACVGVGGSPTPSHTCPAAGPGVGFPICAGTWSGFSLHPEAGCRAHGPRPATSPRPDCGLPARAPARREKPAGRGRAGSILTGPAAVVGWGGGGPLPPSLASPSLL